MGASLRISSWLLRVAFVALALASGGAFAAAYLLLWWMMPQALPLTRRRGGLPFVLALLVLVGAAALWVGRDLGWLNPPSGEPLYLPVLAVALGVVFFLRQVRG